MLLGFRVGAVQDDHFATLADVAGRLREMAEYERSGSQLTPEMMAFINEAVVVQPVEPKSAAALNRYLRTLRPEQDGRFHTRGLPPGEYFATALEALEQGRQFVPDVQARLRDSARRFTVREGETVAIDLKLTPGFE